jgi:tRNA(Ile)-lysidine synthase TilS/MesJ
MVAMGHDLDTRARRALQPLWNALDAVADACADGAVLAVSGGPDSRALLEAFARWRRRPGRIEVVAVDHGLRVAARMEAAAVVARAGALGLEGRVVTLAGLKPDEASLRAARHEALRAVAVTLAVSAVVYAHHRGDVAESVLLHLAGQGGGRRGRAPRTVEVVDGIARVRPFLALDKATLGHALLDLGIDDAVVDEDDVAGRNARARLRGRMLEVLGDTRPEVEAALARHARLLREDDDLIEALVPDDGVVDAGLPPAILRRWLRRRIAALGDDPRTSPAAIDTVLRIAATGGTGAVCVRGGVVWIRRTADGHRLAVEPVRGQSPQMA